MKRQPGKISSLRRLSLLFVLAIFTAAYFALPSHPGRLAFLHDAPKPGVQGQSSAIADRYFADHVQPILQAHCLRCHGSQKQRGGLRLDSLRALLKGGDTGPAIVPHQSAQSLLIAAIGYRDGLQMPPVGKLSAEQIKTLNDWVDRGAPWPNGSDGAVASNRAQSVNGASLWSLQPVKKVAVPNVKDCAWPMAPIDAFILSKLEAHKLAPAPPADQATLIRRVAFDLTGLPPTAEEVQNFLSDEAPDAFAKVVDRLLASPHYGEHWARHWLDLACFAETNHGRIKPNAFRYRDYVIEALNDDVPFNQFVLEQIAGDLVPNPRKNSRGQNTSAIGAGFLWMREIPVKQCDTFDPEVAKADYVADQIDQIGKAFLGLTIGCARCHTHKFDPISQEDFFAMAGFLRSSQMAQAYVAPGKSEPEMTVIWQKASALKREIAVTRLRDPKVQPSLERLDEYLLAVASLRPVASQPMPEDRVRACAKERALDPDRLVRWHKHFTRPGMAFDPFFGPFVRLMTTPADRFMSRLKEILNDGGSSMQTSQQPVYEQLILAELAAAKVDSLAALAKTYQSVLRAAFEASLHSVPNAPHDGSSQGSLSASQERLVAVLSRRTSPLGIVQNDEHLPREAKETIWDLRRRAAQLVDDIYCMAVTTIEGEPEDARLHIRGNSKAPGPVVPRGFLKAIANDVPPLHGSGRLYLAQQIAAADNPLTARVFVNRCWQHLFGDGLVRTPDNFGHLGEAPTHRELLDYLTGRFIESGWSVKALLRLMLLSRTYQMSSAASPEAQSIDPDNKLRQYRTVRRLAAEEVRDSMLAAAEVLDGQLYGPSVLFTKQGGSIEGERRRSIYLNLNREKVMPMLLAFDFPNPNLPFGRRHVSVVPSQSLVLMNSEYVHTVAQMWGQRLAADKRSESERAEAMFWSALGRSPSKEELSSALDFLANQASEYAKLSEAPPPSQVWSDLAHCLFNTNGFLFVR
jgi:hypothetical protein